MKTKKNYLLLLAAMMLIFSPVSAYAEEDAPPEQATAAEAIGLLDELGGEVEPITLKMMVVNPSDKHKQTFPLKAYLPEEVRPEHILDKEDMQVSYDDEKSSYYVSQEIELEPGESVVKTVMLRDVWRISDSELEAFSEEAHGLLSSLVGTKYEEQGRLLLSNVEVLLIQIYESQRDTTLTPEEHISAYRENKSKKDDIEMDLLALRRFVVNSGGDLGIPFLKGSKGGAMGLPGMVTDWESKTEAERLEAMIKGAGGGVGKGQIPAWMLWRMIFIVLFFIGGLSLLFFLIWAHQLNTLRSRKKMEAAQTAASDQKKKLGKKKHDADADEIKLGDFLHTNVIEPEEEKKAS